MEHLKFMRLTPIQEIGRRIAKQREYLGMSKRELARRADIKDSTIIRLERGEFANPQPDTLRRIAEALELPLADLYALADYVVPAELPTFKPYLRSKYQDMPSDAVDDLNKAFERIIKKHGYAPDGPKPGEDET